MDCILLEKDSPIAEAFPLGMACIPRIAKSLRRNGTSDKRRSAVQHEMEGNIDDRDT
jgi:hypothetical protein